MGANTLRRSLVALFAAAISFGAITQAQAETLRIGYQKYGTLVLLKAKGSLEKRLAEQGIFAWSGNSYALALSEALGLEPAGVVRTGMLHYNTPEEVDRLLAALAAM